MRRYLHLVILGTCFMAFLQAEAQYAFAFDSLLQHTTFEHVHAKREVTFLKSKNKNVLIRYNPFVLGLSGALYVYQKVLSAQLATNCPYEVSCSAFSKSCLKEYGIIKGVALSADRLTRCTPFSSLDFNENLLNRDHKIIDPPGLYTFKVK